MSEVLLNCEEGRAHITSLDLLRSGNRSLAVVLFEGKLQLKWQFNFYTVETFVSTKQKKTAVKIHCNNVVRSLRYKDKHLKLGVIEGFYPGQTKKYL